MNVLHLISDEKFLAFISRLFGHVPDMDNRFIAIKPGVDTKAGQSNGLPLWRTVGHRYFRSTAMKEDLAWCDCLIVHCLSSLGARMIMAAPARVAVIWSGWGIDYYGFLPGGDQSLLGYETKELLRNSRRTRAARHVLESIIRSARSGKRFIEKRRLLLPAIRRVDLFSAPIPEEFDQLQRALGPDIRARYVQLNYGSLEQTFQPGPDVILSNDILVGNSAAATNNHAEVFRLLSGMDLTDRRIVVPLSYGEGENQGYRNSVVALGRQLFGDRFIPILNFMPLEEYNALIARCSIVIMNQKRQQALGNIGAMLYRGARVYFHPENPVYRFLKHRGAWTWTTRELADETGLASGTVPQDQRQENRRVLEEFWGHDVVLENVRRFAQTVQRSRKLDA